MDVVTFFRSVMTAAYENSLSSAAQERWLPVLRAMVISSPALILIAGNWLGRAMSAKTILSRSGKIDLIYSGKTKRIPASNVASASLGRNAKETLGTPGILRKTRREFVSRHTPSFSIPAINRNGQERLKDVYK